MGLRSAVASLSALLLLAFSSAGLRCEVVCGFGGLHPNCQANGQAGPKAGMPGMPGMRDDGMALAGSGCRTSIGAPAPACGHSACAPQPMLVRAQISVVVPLALAQAEAWQTRVQPTLERTDNSASGRGPPTSRAATPVALHTMIRV